jgi:hypothetical protein
VTVNVGWDYDEPIFSWYDFAHEASIAAGLTTADAPGPTSWSPHDHYGCTPEEWYAALDAEVLKGLDGMYGRPAKPEAVAQVKRAHLLGYNNYVITARGSFGTLGDRVKAITRSQVIRDNLPVNGVYFAKNKVAKALELNLDYMIDDAPHNFTDLYEAGVNVFLLDERWNRDFSVPEGRRLYSVEEYVDLIARNEGNQFALSADRKRRAGIK